MATPAAPPATRAPAPPAARRTVLGHPRGVLFLSLTETWERFSFYGMRALLVIYMVEALLVPGKIETIGGIGGYRAALESVIGPVSNQVLATQTVGFYSGLVYFTPLLGGLLADRWLGARWTVLLGIALMTAGHFFMVFDATFLLALLCLVLGSGCLKGNIAAQVGHLYGPEDEARRSHGFAIFSTGINIGAVLGPVVCGAVAQVFGWHAGFGLAGVMMLVSAIVYVSGFRDFARDEPAGRIDAAPKMTREQWRMTGLVIGLLALVTVQFMVYDQFINVGLLWIERHVDLETPFGRVPAAWFVSVDAMGSILGVPLLLWIWHRQAQRGGEPGDLGKIALGAALFVAATLTLATGAWVAGEGRTSILFPLVASSFSGVGFIAAWPTMLALVSRRAPAPVNAVMMAAVYLTAFVTGIGSGYISRFYETLSPVQFWLVNACFPLAGMVLVLGAGPLIARRMDALEAQLVRRLPGEEEIGS